MKAMASATGSGLRARPRSALAQLLQRLAADVLHDDVAGAVVLTKLMILTMWGCSTSARNWRSAMAAAMADASPLSRRPLSTTHRSDTLRSWAR